jgi:hypothetical protein
LLYISDNVISKELLALTAFEVQVRTSCGFVLPLAPTSSPISMDVELLEAPWKINMIWALTSTFGVITSLMTAVCADRVRGHVGVMDWHLERFRRHA